MHAGINWKKTLCGAAIVASLAIPAVAQVRIGVNIGRTPPPPLRYEVRTAMPGPGYVWADGYWNWDGGRYVWARGGWRQPPYAGAYWNHPHYDHYSDGWHLHEGHWDREDHDDHHDWSHDRR